MWGLRGVKMIRGRDTIRFYVSFVIYTNGSYAGFLSLLYIICEYRNFLICPNLYVKLSDCI